MVIQFFYSIEDTIDQNEKMADVHFNRMHSGRKSINKVNGRLLKDRHKAGGCRRLISSLC